MGRNKDFSMFSPNPVVPFGQPCSVLPGVTRHVRAFP